MSPNTIMYEETESIRAESIKFSGFSNDSLKYYNEKLAKLSPQEILAWAIEHLPGLYQTTAFGLTGLVALDMISKISLEKAMEKGTRPKHLVPLIFLDTLYHFPETVALANRAASHYNAPLYIFKPVNCGTVQEFESQYGQRLWETNEDSYDYLVKVEPSRRAYEQLGVKTVITGRRRSQRGERENISILEKERGTGLLKLNPLATWDFNRVWTYIRANEVPYNPLLEQGYRSIGDWHSTKPTNDSSNERCGRWEGKQKSECGMHKDYFKMRAAFMAAQKRRQTFENSENKIIC
ncbi:13061_t:CDS:2 [Ambispora leptoticha]|uniref:13061_t:CDS:1 n=1 Tax=Ambispora leptoticha TaxID=144679 RepID=A0A9N8VA10_9GLOM|nr:13061_t:CDS:2 [Ambispora leptoticha]